MEWRKNGKNKKMNEISIIHCLTAVHSNYYFLFLCHLNLNFNVLSEVKSIANTFIISFYPFKRPKNSSDSRDINHPFTRPGLAAAS